MWNPKQSIAIQKSLDHLSSKFNEIEKMCQSSVQKGLSESQKILSQQTTFNSELYSNLIKEQNRLETNQRALTSIKRSYNDELDHLKQIVLNNTSEPSSAAEKSLMDLKNSIEETFLDTRNKMLEMPELSYFDNSFKERVQNFFEESFQRADYAFLQFNSFKELNNAQINLKKIEMIANTNMLTLTGIENVISQSKRRLIRSLEAANQCSASYGNQVQASQEILGQIKEKVLEIVQDAKEQSSSSRASSRQTSPRAQFGVDSVASGRIRKSCDAIEKLLIEAVGVDSKKTELFEAANKEFENICSKFNSAIKDLTKHAEVFKSNHQTLESTINKDRKKSQEQENERTNNLEVNVKSPSSLLKTHSRQLSSPSNVKSPQHVEPQDFKEILSQKMTHLKTITGNFIGSCEKMAKFAIDSSSEGNYAVLVFENERKLMENYMNSVADFVQQNKNKLQESPLAKSSSTKSFKFAGLELSPQSYEKESLLRNITSVKSTDSKAEKLKFPNSPDQGSKDLSLKSRLLSGDSKGFKEDSTNKGKEDRFYRTFGAPAEQYESNLRSTLSPMRSEDQGEKDAAAKKAENKAMINALIQKVKDLSEQNEKLVKEVPKITKMNKKLEIKAEKRKKTVKQLFELVTEKEKELNYYKNGYASLLNKAKNPSDNEGEQGKDLSGKKEENIHQKYRALEEKIGQKDLEIEKLREVVAAAAIGEGQKVAKGPKVQKSPRFVEDEEEDLRSQEKGKNKMKLNLDDLLTKTRELEQKRESVEEEIQNLQDTTSPSKVKELNSMLTSLKKEREQNLFKIKEVKDAMVQEKNTAEKLQAENKVLEERCHELLNDIEKLQEHKQKIEKGYQEEVDLLNQKVKQLSEYIQGLESKKNEKMREALSPEKRKMNLDLQKEVVSPQKLDDNQAKENRKLKGDIKRLVSKVECLLEHFGIDKQEYSMMDSDEKIEIISERVRKEEKASNKEDLETVKSELKEQKQLNKEKDSQIKKLELGIREQKAANEDLIKKLDSEEGKSRKQLQKVSDLESEVAGLEAKVVDLEKNNQLLREEINGQKEKLKEVSIQRQNVEGLYEDLKSLLQSKEEEIKSLVQEKGKDGDLEGVVNKKENELKELKEKVEDKESSIRELEKKNRVNENSIAELQDKLREKENRLNEKEKEINSEKERLNKEKEAAVQELKSIYSKNTDEANTKLLENIENYKLEASELNDQIKALKVKLQAKENELEEIERENEENEENLKKALEEKETLEDQFRSLEKKNQKLQNALDSTSSLKTRMEEELNSINQQLEADKKTLQEKLENDIREKDNEIKSKQEEISRTEKINGELGEASNKLQKRVDELKKLNEELQAEKESFLNEKILASEESSQARDTIKKKISEYEKVILEEREKEKAIQEELDQVKKQKEQVEKKLGEAEKNVQDLEKQLKEQEVDLQNKLKEMTGKKEELTTSLQNKDNELNNKNQELETLQEKVKEIQKELEEEKKKGQEVALAGQRSLGELKKALDEKSKELAVQNESLQKEIDRLTQENKIINQEYQVLLGKQDELQKQVKDLERKQEEIQKGFETDLESERQLIKTLQNETIAESQRLHKKIEKQQREIEKSNENYQSVKADYDKLVNEQKERQENIQRLEQEIDQLTGSLRAKVSELEVTKGSGSTEVESIRNEYNSQLQNLNIQVETLKRNRDELEGQVKGLKELLQKEKGQTEQLKSVKNDQEGNVKELSEEISSLKSELVRSKESLEKAWLEKNKADARERGMNDQLKLYAALKKEIFALFAHNQPDVDSLGIKLEDREEIQIVVKAIKETMENQDKEIEDLHNQLQGLKKTKEELELLKDEMTKSEGHFDDKIVKVQEHYNKEISELKKVINTLKLEAGEKMKRVNEDIKEVIEILPTEYVPDDQQDVEDDLREQVQNAVWMNAIREYVIEANGIRREYQDLVHEVHETQKEAKDLDEKFQQDIEIKKDFEQFEGEDQHLKLLVPASRKLSGADNNNLKPPTSYAVEIPPMRKKSDNKDPSFGPDELDDVKVRSFLEESVKETKSDKRDERMLSQEQEQIKHLYEQLRQLQDDNDKLESENRQLKTKSEMLGFVNEDLKGELTDKESEIKKLEHQLQIIKEEFTKVQNEKDRKGSNPIAHEKEHIRTMFSKFMLSALQGNKDADDLLKLLLSLLELSEKEKTQMLTEFKAKNTKKGVFAKLF